MPREPLRRRNGQPQSCENCRLSKIRCDHATPACGRCIQRNLGCVYHPAPMTKKLAAPRAPSENVQSASNPLQNTPMISGQQESLYDLPTPVSLNSKIGSGIFKGGRASVGNTRFSAVFVENSAAFDSDLLSGPGEDSYNAGGDISRRLTMNAQPSASQKHIAFSVETLQYFPSSRGTKILLDAYSTYVDVWAAASAKILNAFVSQMWEEYGHLLEHPRTTDKLSSLATILSENTTNTLHISEDAHWLNWFSGRKIRWEMVGMAFSMFGFAILRCQAWEPLFQLPEYKGRDRRLAAYRMQECAQGCLRECEGNESNDLMMCVMKSNGKLLSNIVSDESDVLRNVSGTVMGAFVTNGLHRLPKRQRETPHTQYRIALSAALYYLDKSESLFMSRPPHLSRHYCTYQLPLDLSEDELFGDVELFHDAIKRLDCNGWATTGEIYPMTLLRAMCLLTPVRESILELSLGVNSQFAGSDIDDLHVTLDNAVSSYPAHIQYSSLDRLLGDATSDASSRSFYILTRVQLEVLLQRFLLERIRLSRTQASGQALLEISQETVTVLLSLWLHHDRLIHYNNSFHWLIMCYGVPAAGVICVELVKSLEPGLSTLRFSRSEVIQSLTVFMSFLSWIRPTDGNYVTCHQLAQVIKRVVDRVLEPPRHMTRGLGSQSTTLRANYSADSIDNHATGYESMNVPSIEETNFEQANFEQTDLWLSSIDWTQGDWLAFDQQIVLD